MIFMYYLSRPFVFVYGIILFIIETSTYILASFLYHFGLLAVFFGLPLSILAFIEYEKYSLSQIEVHKVYNLHYVEKCPPYRDASTLDRFVDADIRSLSWCSKYLHKI